MINTTTNRDAEALVELANEDAANLSSLGLLTRSLAEKRASILATKLDLWLTEEQTEMYIRKILYAYYNR